MSTVRRALALSFAERYALIAIGLVGNVVIARLLTPAQIGLYSVSLAVVGIAQVLRDFGIGNFLIQEKNLTESHIRTAFGFSLAIGSVLFIVIYVGAPFAARFYNEVELVKTMRISALNFLVLPFCTVSLSLLRREMAFRHLITINLAAMLAGLLATIGLGYAGYGANSMAAGAVVSNVFTGGGAWIARNDRQLLLPGFSAWRSLLSFGTQTSVAGVVTTITMDINDLALGKILGFEPVALISRGQGLMNLFHRDMMNAVRNVALPAYARAHRDGQSVEPAYLASVTAVTAIGWPFYGFCALFSLEILRLMFGPQWDQAAALVPVFCLAGSFACATNLITTAMMASGHVALVTRSELIFQPLRALMIVAAALLFQSLMACALAFALAFAVYVPFIHAFKARCLPSDRRALTKRLMSSLAVTLVSLAIPTEIAWQAGPQRTEPAGTATLALAAVACAASWLAAVLILRHPLADDPMFKRLMFWRPREAAQELS